MNGKELTNEDITKINYNIKIAIFMDNQSLLELIQNIYEWNKKYNYEIKDNELNLIMTQNIEGYWEFHDETKDLYNKVGNNIYENVSKKIKELNLVEQENKIIDTILVIYYITNKFPHLLGEYKLIIKKAIKFLIKYGINYEEFLNISESK